MPLSLKEFKNFCEYYAVDDECFEDVTKVTPAHEYAYKEFKLDKKDDYSTVGFENALDYINGGGTVKPKIRGLLQMDKRIGEDEEEDSKMNKKKSSNQTSPKTGPKTPPSKKRVKIEDESEEDDSPPPPPKKGKTVCKDGVCRKVVPSKKNPLPTKAAKDQDKDKIQMDKLLGNKSFVANLEKFMELQKKFM